MGSLPEVIIGNEQAEIFRKEFPILKPSTNQVLVQVEFTSVNPTDLIKLLDFYGKPADYSTTLLEEC